jgi:hypothetical protein
MTHVNSLTNFLSPKVLIKKDTTFARYIIIISAVRLAGQEYLPALLTRPIVLLAPVLLDYQDKVTNVNKVTREIVRYYGGEERIREDHKILGEVIITCSIVQLSTKVVYTCTIFIYKIDGHRQTLFNGNPKGNRISLQDRSHLCLPFRL